MITVPPSDGAVQEIVSRSTPAVAPGCPIVAGIVVDVAVAIFEVAAEP